MAEQIIKRLIDDIDGGEAEETVQFSLDGVPYEIDLSAANAKKVRDSLAPFVEHARKAGGAAAGGRRRRSRAASSRERSADIRAWAKARGIKVNERGRIPATVVEEYERAH
ncbi:MULTISPECIES: histone-like nucleoid-structuring protein Lsr2 [Actinoallomurus]|jgi:nucleoid-associated protein Lsr2|uniref:Lsr2 family protein n=1 Tax=Actinoallomurus iriomotensis TaxID=478107 RepID=A0A9W6VPE3_9ACTN|nr:MULTISPECIES: Lsr2 family protein [Actinoallomurus]GLY79838.1 Lsr2 family protein [Actinoallomurus iriomotensis]GLY88515.1 Lsr2 family protein [Actinoallomurus iriomotensis]